MPLNKKDHPSGQMTRRWPSMTLLNINQRCHVKKDTEIRLYLQERRKGMTQRVAAARAGIGERTARMIGKHALTRSKRTGPGSSLNWSVILRCKAQRSLRCCANDILAAIDPRRCGPSSVIFNTGASYMGQIVR